MIGLRTVRPLPSRMTGSGALDHLPPAAAHTMMDETDLDTDDLIDNLGDEDLHRVTQALERGVR